MQPDEGGLDPLLAHVPLHIDGEPVATQGVAHRPGLDAREVDAAGAELLEHVQQRAGAVVRELDEESGLIGAGGLAHATGPGHLDEAGDGIGVVRHSPGDDLQPVLLGGQRVAQRRLEAGVLRRGGQRAGGRRGGGPGHVDRLGEVLVDPAAALRPGVRVGGDGVHVLQPGAGPAGQDEGDRHGHLGGDDQGRGGHEVVQGGVDPALDGVLDGHDSGLHRALAQVVQGRGHVRAGIELDVDGGDLAQRHLGEGASRTEEGPERSRYAIVRGRHRHAVSHPNFH